MKRKLSLFVLVASSFLCTRISEAKEQEIIIEKNNQVIQLESSLHETDIRDAQPGQIVKDEPIIIRNKLNMSVILYCKASIIVDDTELNSGYDAFFEVSSIEDTGANGDMVKQLTISPNETVEVNAVSVLNGEKLGNSTQSKVGNLKWIFEVEEDINYSSSDSSSNSSQMTSSYFSSSTSINDKISNVEQKVNSNDMKNLLGTNTDIEVLPKTDEYYRLSEILSIVGLFLIANIIMFYIKTYN